MRIIHREAAILTQYEKLLLQLDQADDANQDTALRSMPSIQPPVIGSNGAPATGLSPKEELLEKAMVRLDSYGQSQSQTRRGR